MIMAMIAKHTWLLIDFGHQARIKLDVIAHLQSLLLKRFSIHVHITTKV